MCKQPGQGHCFSVGVLFGDLISFPDQCFFLVLAVARLFKANKGEISNGDKRIKANARTNLSHVFNCPDLQFACIIILTMKLFCVVLRENWLRPKHIWPAARALEVHRHNHHFELLLDGLSYHLTPGMLWLWAFRGFCYLPRVWHLLWGEYQDGHLRAGGWL